MPERRHLHFDIADRQYELRDTAAPDDFVLARRDSPVPFPANALAYCADMQAERVLYSMHGPGVAALFQAPFLYAAQLCDAGQVVTVPFERLPDVDPCIDCRPTLIFSPGRAGSTLLARLLRACGANCASEPDMLSQICRFEREDRMRIGPDTEIALLHACLAALCRLLGPSPFIKLRSHCNARPLPLIEAAAHAPAILLMRRMDPWALSRHLAFGEAAASVASVLRHTLDAADKLLGLPEPPRILWFEDLRANPLAVLRRLLPDTPLDPLAIARVMATDSQAGTSVARNELAAATAEPGFTEHFRAAWDSACVGAEWSEATLALLAEVSAECRPFSRRIQASARSAP
jgi:hypothetical protein